MNELAKGDIEARGETRTIGCLHGGAGGGTCLRLRWRLRGDPGSSGGGRERAEENNGRATRGPLIHNEEWPVMSSAAERSRRVRAEQRPHIWGVLEYT